MVVVLASDTEEEADRRMIVRMVVEIAEDHRPMAAAEATITEADLHPQEEDVIGIDEGLLHRVIGSAIGRGALLQIIEDQVGGAISC